MSKPHLELKTRQRAERDGWPDFVSLRIHRALSWMRRAEDCEDGDGRFIFHWIAFNAAYANELGEFRLAENRRFGEFLERLVELDRAERLKQVLWDQFQGPIRVLLQNKFVFQPYWDNVNGLQGGENWADHFERRNRAATGALMTHDTGKLLGVVFARLYTLRNQLIHGGATWDSSVNREQVRDANAIMGALVPNVIEIMMDNAREHWGEPCYPVRED